MFKINIYSLYVDEVYIYHGYRYHNSWFHGYTIPQVTDFDDTIPYIAPLCLETSFVYLILKYLNKSYMLLVSFREDASKLFNRVYRVISTL